MVTGGLTQIDIRGSGGQTLAERWSGEVNSYLGSAVHGFSNMLFVYGPLSPAGFANSPNAAELHGEQIVDMIDFTNKGGLYATRGHGRGRPRMARAHRRDRQHDGVPPREILVLGNECAGKEATIAQLPRGLAYVRAEMGRDQSRRILRIRDQLTLRRELLVGTDIRRVITGRVNLWGTGDEGASVGNDPAENAQLFPYFPDASGHGTRLLAAHFALNSPPAIDAGGGTTPKKIQAAAKMERLPPRLSHLFEPGTSDMHTTDTVNYGICGEGDCGWSATMSPRNASLPARWWCSREPGRVGVTAATNSRP
ncbi:MAG: hypothetical protein LLG14_14740 [Nocardiaceae bacterium]|nr:hypothetical protein [Nocardiaceae bacterium]